MLLSDARRGPTLLMIGAAALLLIAASPARGEQSKADDAAAQEVRKAADGFYAALNEMFKGEAAPMEKVWSHAEDVSYMGPMGDLFVGWQKIQPLWGEQAGLHLGGHVGPEQLHVVATGDMGITVGYERGTNTPGGKTRHVSIRATNVFRREGGEWKMIGHQTDLIPQMEKKSAEKK
jgi:ketosteroid isomerase-like protein